MTEHIFLQSPTLTASLANEPTTRGHVLITLTTQLFTPPTNTTTKPILETTRQIADALCQITKSKRCALAYDGDLLIHLRPIHGLSGEKWTPVLDNDKEFHTEFPGYLSTKNGPTLDQKDLDEMRDRIAAYSGLTEKEGRDKSFHGEDNDSNLFARIVRGEITEQWRIWESPSHIAFLTPFGNTPGYTVLVPRKHTSSDIFSLAPDDYNALAVDAAGSVSALLKEALGLEMCGMFFEGLEIDYSHVKLVPVHTSKKLGEPLREEFRELYRGSVSTKLGLTAYPEEELQKMAGELRARFEV
ncbi:uncharacterized protein TRUGW13939_05800 [Talaromyces rugulosus]|uniref:HIT domain-containing protein n=1 Tax=Talaromyces rugulosus TaxID=121627 RepID=A0A7H8R1A5_TALRU|nr:uncharacterized protein TRUGW13939_05800 [Talaromyces rugulosus]QKX58673.1 hypothetical protein TRUGW13939_05800 [Talaromyces rugulosus]